MALYILFSVLLVTIVCRSRNMDHTTALLARLQHWLPLVLVTAALPVFSTTRWASELIGAALVAYLWMERRRPGCAAPLMERRNG